MYYVLGREVDGRSNVVVCSQLMAYVVESGAIFAMRGPCYVSRVFLNFVIFEESSGKDD